MNENALEWEGTFVMSSPGPPKKVDNKLAAARKDIEEKRKGSGRVARASAGMSCAAAA
jgi:hypothetical protein